MFVPRVIFYRRVQCFSIDSLIVIPPVSLVCPCCVERKGFLTIWVQMPEQRNERYAKGSGDRDDSPNYKSQRYCNNSYMDRGPETTDELAFRY
jgi:hypothetical protein